MPIILFLLFIKTPYLYFSLWDFTFKHQNKVLRVFDMFCLKCSKVYFQGWHPTKTNRATIRVTKNCSKFSKFEIILSLVKLQHSTEIKKKLSGPKNFPKIFVCPCCHTMQLRKHKTFTHHANTRRYLNSPIVYMKKLLNELEK